MPPPPALGPDAPTAFRAARLVLARARVAAAEARRQSAYLCDRARTASRTARAARDFVDSHQQLWAEWHRGWAALRATPGVGPGARRLLRVCAYCGAAHLPGGGGASAWRPVPPAVRDLWREGVLDLIPSHGACPDCAAARLGG